MAISKDEFNRLKERDDDHAVYEAGTNAHTILQFLATHSDQAFPPKEIAAETEIPPGSVRGTLSRLAETGLLEHADKYWSINETELVTRRAALVSQQGIDTDQYGGFDREAESENAELPPNRERREE
jgi:predicted transcriptional regulator